MAARVAAFIALSWAIARRSAARRLASARFLAPESLRLFAAALLLAELLLEPFDFVLLLDRLAAGRFLAAAKVLETGMMPVSVIRHTAIIKDLFLMSHMLKLSFETT